MKTPDDLSLAAFIGCALAWAIVMPSVCGFRANAKDPMRSNQLSPRLESLEGRTLLDGSGAPDSGPGQAPAVEARTGADFGVNLARNTDWSTDQAWVDVTHLFRQWGQWNKPWLDAPNLPLTDQGLPLADASALTYLKDYHDGTYTLTFAGTATVDASGMGRLAGPVTTSNGVTRGEIVVDHTRGELLILNVKGVDPSDPIRDLHLTAPGYEPGSGRAFTEAYLHRLQPFSTIRFMDWTATNGSTAVSWADRVRPDSFLKTGAGGIAWEDAIALANAAGKDAWINVPEQADDDYVRQLAQLFRDTLATGLKVYVEYSNELWNMQFAQSKHNQATAKTNPALTKPDDFGRAGEQAALRLSEIAAIFRAEYGEESGRFRPVLCGQSANTYFLDVGLAYLKSHGANPSDNLFAIAIAPYVDLDPAVDKPGLTLDGLFASMNGFVADKLSGWIANHKALADRYGLPLLAYEGGQHLVAWNSADRVYVNESLKASAQDDPRMGQVLRDLAAVWADKGGALFDYYTIFSTYGRSGYWGLLQANGTAGSEKWDAILGIVLEAGDATLDGRVDFDDFAVFRSSFGQASRWWEQGDFNGDHVIDFADYDLLVAHLGPLTADQLAEVRAFDTR